MQAGSGVQKLKLRYIRINLDSTWNNMAPVKLFRFGQLKTVVYALQQLYTVIVQATLGCLSCILTVAAADDYV